MQQASSMATAASVQLLPHSQTQSHSIQPVHSVQSAHSVQPAQSVQLQPSPYQTQTQTGVADRDLDTSHLSGREKVSIRRQRLMDQLDSLNTSIRQSI